MKWLIRALAIVGVFALGGPVPLSAAGSPPCGTWNVVPSANVNVANGKLLSVAAITNSDVWAVAAGPDIPYYETAGEANAVENWNGVVWKAPNLSLPGRTIMSVVAASSSSDVWALGTVQFSGVLVARHWNGSAWKSVSMPEPSGTDSDGFTVMSAVTTGPDDAWAVGNGLTPSGMTVTMVDHWNGWKWKVIKSPSGSTELRAVTATGPNDVWVAGDHLEQVINNYQAFAAHWNGRSWTTSVPETHPGFVTGLSLTSGTLWAVAFNLDDVAIPSAIVLRYNLKTGAWAKMAAIWRAGMTSVVALGPRNVWAFGYWFEPGLHPAAMAMHWNGSKWSTGTNPNPGIGDNFQAASKTESGSLWAVGFYFDAGAGSWPLAQRWNGSSWSAVSVPTKTYPQGQLVAASADAPDDVWAVGDYYTAAGPRPMVDHRNGAKWQAMALPTPAVLTGNLPPDPISEFGGGGGGGVEFSGITALAPNNVWATGTWSDVYGFTSGPLIEHWNGKVWSVAETPEGFNFETRTEDYGAGMNAIQAIGPNDIWAVGWLQDGEYNGTFALHWNGLKWHLSIQPRLTATQNGMLESVAVSPTGDLWTGGEYQGLNGPEHPVIFHWSGYSWDRTVLTAAHPKDPSAFSGMQAILPLTATDVWAGGDGIEHFDGHKWSMVPDALAPIKQTISGMAAVGPRDIWAVGEGQSGQAIEHWNGAKWALGQLAKPGKSSVYYNVTGLVASGNTIWALGQSSLGSLVERFDACAATQ